MFANNKIICFWLIMFGSCLGNKAEEIIEELQKELKETKKELKDTKEGLIQHGQVIDSLRKEIDSIRNDRNVPLCKFFYRNRAR